MSFVLSSLFSFETFTTLFMFAGTFKGDPRFAGAPVDITLFFFALSLAVGLHLLVRRKFVVPRASLPIVGGMMLFAAYMIASLIWTPGTDYAMVKVKYFSILNVWSTLAAVLIISSDWLRVKRFMFATFGLSVWIAVETLALYSKTTEMINLYVMGGIYLEAERVMGVGALIVLAYALFHRSNVLYRLVGLGFFFLFMSAMLVAGGRGPLLAVVIPALVPLFYAVRINRNGIRIRAYSLLLLGIFVSGIAVIAYMFATGKATVTLVRMTELFSGSNGTSGMTGTAVTRLSFYETAFRLWKENPLFGYGVGSWPVLTGELGNFRAYPHNIFLEILVEFGIAGFLPFAVMLVAAVRCALPLRRWHATLPFLIVPMVFLNTLVNTQVSGDLPDNRFFFFTVGLMAFMGLKHQAGESRSDA